MAQLFCQKIFHGQPIVLVFQGNIHSNIQITKGGNIHNNIPKIIFKEIF